MVDVENIRMASPASRGRAGTQPRSGVLYSPGRAVLREPWVRAPVRNKPRRGVLVCLARRCYQCNTAPRRGLGVIKRPSPGLAEYRSPWAIEDAAPRLCAGTPTRGRGGPSTVFHINHATVSFSHPVFILLIQLTIRTFLQRHVSFKLLAEIL